MEDIRDRLKDLIEEMPMLFEQLKSLLLPASKHANEVLLLKAQHDKAMTEWGGSRITIEEHNLVINRVRFALINIIDAIRQEDLKCAPAPTAAGSRATLHEYHSFTCDRVDQSDRFYQLFGEKKSTKTHFFYLYGLDLQSHKGLFKRIAHDLEGRLQDYLNPGLETGCHSLKIDLTFDASNDPEIYKLNILKSLFAALSIRVNEQEPLLEKNLSWLWKHSPSTQSLKADDFVCILVSVSQWHWNKVITPAVTRWFITEFCKDGLPEDAPTFLFFFAIAYEDDNSPVEQEVTEIIKNSELVHALPELEMVGRGHIAQWFSKYDFLAASSRERKELMNNHFGNENEHYMEDVELSLQKLIDQYNKRFF